MAWAAKQQGGASAANGLMHLESENKILLECLTSRLGAEKKREPCELKIADFDDVLYKLFVSPDSPNEIVLQVAVRDWENLKSNGAQKALDTNFPGCTSQPEQGFNVAIKVDADSLPKGPWGSTGEACAKQLADIKTLLVGAPLMEAFSTLSSDSPLSSGITTIAMRKPTQDGGGNCYIVPKGDRVTVVFAVDFADETDKAVTRIFLQEFVEAQRSVNNCPPANFSRGAEPPMEIQSIPNIDGNPDIAGFISFTIFKSHIGTTPKKKEATKLLVHFLTYLQYHVKATKTYMHMRMRSKVNALLQVLNRATQTSTETKAKKTITGKTWVKK